MTEAVYTVAFPFCGLGAGALGFLEAQATVFGRSARFRSVGGIDNDPAACADFERLTKSPALCADVATLTPAQLRAFAGDVAPDVVFGSPPCKGYSGLLGEKRSRTEPYQKLNRLVLDWVELVLAAWPDAPPRLLLLENVPRIATRGAGLLRKVRSRLHEHGYVSHGTAHDCGELGGLAQHRKRFLLVARHTARVPTLLYQPVKRRVRGCGEVLGTLPLPGDPAAGPLHQLPRISMLNWIRLALIPPGGDWRDLPTETREASARDDRTHRNKCVVYAWDDPAGAVIGATRPGSGAPSVADLRVRAAGAWGGGTYGVLDPARPAGTVIGEAAPSTGAFSVADDRVAPPRFNNVFVVLPWDASTGTVTGGHGPSSGGFSVADPRIVATGYPHTYGVLDWAGPAHTITGKAHSPGTGPFSVADPRLTAAPGTCWFKGKHGVMDWDAPARTVIGGPSNGADAVADPRLGSGGFNYANQLVVLDWLEPARTITGGLRVGAGGQSVADARLGCAPRGGAYGVLGWSTAAGVVSGHMRIDNAPCAVADPRVPGNPPLRVRHYLRDLRDPPAYVPVLPTADGTWHRPLTTLELAALQGLPTVIDGEPLTLAGRSASAWRERIGNAVPPPAAQAIAERMLATLLGADMERFTLSGDGAVWVDGPESTPVELGSVQ